MTDIEARDAAKDLAVKEGILLRHLLRGTFAAARKSPRRPRKNAVLLAMLPTPGERYLSTILFEGINEVSDEEPVGAAVGRITRSRRPVRDELDALE